jgi:type II secretory pathway pseudopilin PulG
MERKQCRPTKCAWTLIELLVVIAVLAILAALVPAGTRKAKARARRIQCVDNLKRINLASRLWYGGRLGSFSSEVAGTNSGVLEWGEGGIAARLYQAMSNELTTPKILICPSDTRIASTNFGDLKNENLSYFIGLDASATNAQMVLSGDRNITNGLSPVRGILLLAPHRPAGWTDAMHVKLGNLALMDGSVASYSTPGLREALKPTGDATNRIALPE